ncbi:MAG TPA: hypothetical protein VEJ63_16065 [Planctomycetota bacterium]|nr:hypothetical protein [Planctomycetota bacterium]
MKQHLVILFALIMFATWVHSEDAAQKLSDAYAPKPFGYPAGKEYAQPDASVYYRWHFYNDDAIERFEDAQMLTHVDKYNPLEDKGVSVAQGMEAKFAFVEKHATEGKFALQADFPAAAIQKGKAAIYIGECVGPTYSPSYNPALHAVAAYWCHYRWLKVDIFNPLAVPVHIRVMQVPMVLKPGANIVAVRTPDLVGYRGDYPAANNALSISVRQPAQDVTLFIDNVRMEQEVPKVLTEKGRILHFPAYCEAKGAPVAWPGLTVLGHGDLYSSEKKYGWVNAAKPNLRGYHGSSFRSNDNGLMWGSCSHPDSPIRVDVPNGQYGVYLMAYPTGGWGQTYSWRKGLKVKLNGGEQEILPVRTDEQVNQITWSGEAWDYRPGYCLWEQLYRPHALPFTKPASASVTDGHVLIELPQESYVRAIFIYPKADEPAALKELGRINYLLAESWDVTHPWVKGDFAEQGRYIGFHEEATKPETIPQRLTDLKLSDADYKRGFVLFHRGLTEAVYQDTIPTPAETAFKELRAFGAPGEKECFTLGVLPLAEVKGLKISVGDLSSKNGGRIPASAIDVRVSRYHQKCMEYGHHNHTYNFQEMWLVRRPALDLYPAVAKRVYFDVAVPQDAKVGEYSGQVAITGSDGKSLATVPVVFEVLSVELKKPPLNFASSFAHPALKEYGLNTFNTTYDDAVAQKYDAFVIWPYDAAPPSFKGKRFGWGGFIPNKDLLQTMVADAKAGKGPRGFFGDYCNGQAQKKEQAEAIMKEIPGIDIMVWKIKLFAFALPWQHEWQCLGPMTLGTGAPLDEAKKSGAEFWFCDGLRQSKEQPARFTFGFWLWRSGASGRFTTLATVGDTGQSAYYTMKGGDTNNVDCALMPSLGGGHNPTRDLLLVREGIDDYRYIYTLEQALKAADEKKLATPAVAAAKKFRDELHASLDLDLKKYYESRVACYSENWYVLPGNPWNSEKFTSVRRACADHIQALQK